MFTKNERKRIPLQRYWTTRYVYTLAIGLLVVTIISAVWIRHQTFESRISMMEFMAQEIANRFVNEEPGRPDENIQNFLEKRGQFSNMESTPYIYIVNTEGRILSSNTPQSPYEQRINPSILNKEEKVQKLSINQAGNLYLVKQPIELGSVLLGWAVVMDTEEHLNHVNQEYKQLFVMIAVLAVLGWAAIYFLSRRLSKPIKDVAKAARQVQEGNYDIQLPSQVKEEEVYELVHSFKEMSQQLQRLEGLRSELLAGVTHELKTPITSVSGLLQAVKNDVVTGEEAKEFLDISLKETTKMKTMVEDLLAFNSFVANAVPMNFETYSLQNLIKETIHQWEITQDEQNEFISAQLPEKDIQVRVDSVRFQQIITNLLNNAKQAIEETGSIEINVNEESKYVNIDVKDTGLGIPEEEQAFIFERFYRGEGKKYKVGGLGLGLPFSKMIAQTLGGDLKLVSSSETGTTFRLTLPKVE
ncbi:Signal transduction histidine kinase [Salinibacillus kushneri]|uniref:histidine kinase n=1 Tax=Salinibacillus kushneri TaxID=237682 RepID=A0A1I0CFJ3_9BACI|nr:HAMP domain-containing sensor histidine kinase [Salinibacillus kushneri]SET18367.1 Signal transduction histidine kinase [Salinibacillus kushneri]